MPNMDNSLLEAVKFDEKGLVCAIAQDRQTRRVLMVAWMNVPCLLSIASNSILDICKDRR